jgi:hypothetical protein
MKAEAHKVERSPNPDYGCVITSGKTWYIALPLDLRTNSPAFGQLLMSDAVALGNDFGANHIAVDPETTRLIITGTH